MSEDTRSKIEQIYDEIATLEQQVNHLRDYQKRIDAVNTEKIAVLERKVQDLEHRMTDMEKEFQMLCHDLKHHC